MKDKKVLSEEELDKVTGGMTEEVKDLEPAPDTEEKKPSKKIPNIIEIT